MSASSKSNAGSSASARPTEPPRNEKELLRLRQANAKAALRVTAREVGQKLVQIVDPRVTVREHPWKTSGIAALAGFFVGFKVSSPAEASPAGAPEPPIGPSTWDTLTSTLIETGSGAVKSALMPWLAGKIQEWMPKSDKVQDETPPFEKGGPGGI